MQSRVETARAKSKRKAVAGVLAAIILFAMIFTVGSGFFLFVGQSAQSADQANIARASDQLQAGQEKLLVTAGITGATDHGSNPCANCMWVRANNSGGVPSSIIDIYITCVSSHNVSAICESGQLLSNSKASPGSHFLKQNPDLNVTLPITLGIGTSTKYLTSCPSNGCSADITISKAAFNYSNGEVVVVSLLTSAGNVFSAQYPPPANPVTTVVTVKSVTTHVTLTQVGGGPQLSVQMKATPTQTLSCSNGCITLTATVFNFAPWSANNVSISLNEPYASGTASVDAYSSCSPRFLDIPIGGNRSFSCRFSASTGAVGGFVSFSGHASGTLNTVFVTSADSLSNSIEVGGIASVTTQGAFAANFYLLKYSSCTQSSATQHAFNGTCIRNASPPLSNLPSGSYLAAGSNYYTAFYVQITNAFNTTLPITQYTYLFGDPDISGELFYFLAGSYDSSAAPQGVYYPNYPASGTPTLTAYPSDCRDVNPTTNVPLDSNCLYVKPGQTVTLTIAACGYSSSSWAWGGTQDAGLFDSGSTNCTMTPPDFTVPEGTSLGIVVSFFYKGNNYSQMMPFEGQALLRSTSTAVNCAPSQLVGGSTKCTATLTDTDGTPSQPFLTTPTGNVTFAEANGNGTFSSSSCILNAGLTLISTENPMAGPVGTTVTVTGANFAPLSVIRVEFNGARVTTIPATVTTSAAGTFTATFNVPSSPTGPQTVTAMDASANTASATFTVMATEPTSSITLSPMQGPVGTTVTVTGAGFAPSSTITIKFNGAVQATVPVEVTTSAAGTFTATFNVPSSPTGPQTVTAMDASANTATAAFTVMPSECSVIYTPAAGVLGYAKIQASYAGDSYHMGSSGTTTITLLNPTTTTVGCVPISFSLGSTSQCTATLAGFEGSVNGEQIGWSQIGGTGNVSFSSSSCVLSGWACQMNVTGLRSGSAIVQASYAGDSNFNAASSGNTTLTVTSSMTLKPTSGPVGTSVTVTGAGFAPTSVITITFNGVKMTTIPATVTTNALGAFTATFVVPSSTAGAQTVTATDASSDSASATFTVTSSIALSPTSGLVGTKVTVTGSGFASTSNITITFNGVAQTTIPAVVTTSAFGAFTATFVVPSSTAGAQVVTATDASSNTASATFTVTSSITLSPTQGPVGTTVTVTGAGLAPTSVITITFNGVKVTTIPATVTTNALGAFTATFVVPSSTAGAQTVTATDASSDSASATFTVATPTITLSPLQGAVGATVRVRGSNFVPSSTITIKFNGATVTTIPATVTTSALGAFTATFVVPSSTVGAQTVTATDASSNTASATFTVTNPTIVLSPIKGLFGISVNVTGSGFSVLTTIGTITFNGATPATQTCTSQTTSATGTFTCTFTVPSVAVGAYAVVLSGSDVGSVPADTATATFTVTAPTITVSPTQGPVGTFVTVTGAGFSHNTLIGSITIAGGTIVTQTCTSQTTSAAGAFACTFTVPIETLGAHIVTVSGSDVGTVPSDTATATFTVTAPTITLSPIQGPAGVTVTVTGAGFSVLTTIGTITFNGATPATQTCTSQTTSATGALTCAFTVPTVTAGAYTVTVSGSNVGTVPADTASATFTITTPAITLSLTQGPAGTPITVTGSGFSVLTTIGTITFNGATPATQTCTSQTTTASGAFTCTFTVPSVAAGTYTVVLSGSDHGTVPADTASATLTITTPAITLSLTQGPAGTPITVTGSGFSVLTTIGTTTFNGATPATQTCTSQTTSATGTFTCTFTVPTVTVGTYAVTVSGSNVGTVSADTASTTFIITTPAIALSPVSGPIGTVVTVTGTGFSINTLIGSITIAGGTITTQTCTSQTTSAAGAFTCTFTVPTDALGARAVTVSGSDVGTVPADTASAVYTVTPLITLSPTQGPAGVTVTVTGSYFASNSHVTIKLAGTTMTTVPATITTSATGTFTATFVVPSSTSSGAKAVTATDASADTGTATFTVTKPAITLSPTSGAVGTTVTVTGSGFSVLTTIGTITFNGATPATQTCTSQTTSAAGAFTCTFTVPTATAASYTVIVSGSDVGTVPADTASTTFKITPTITLSPTQGPVGTTVTVTGSNFAPSSIITIAFNGATVTTVPATVTSSALGAFTATFVVPSSTAGAKTVKATDASSNTASATFTVTTPAITLSPNTGAVGTTVTVTGSGFSVLTTIGTITFGGATPASQTCTSQTTSAAGAFTCTFTVPTVTAGAYTVTVSGSDVGTVPADTASATFTVTATKLTPTLTLSPTQGPVGTTVTATGANYAPLSTITITFNGATVTTVPATVTTSAAGGFTATFIVPSSTAGAKTVTGKDASANSASATFTVTTPTITLTPIQGPTGVTVTVTGTGFSVLTTIGTITFNGATPATQTCTAQTTSATGTFTCTFTVPTAAAAAYTVTVSGSNVGTVPADTASATFTVTTPTITLSPIQGMVGTSVTVTGSGFSVLTTIGTITFNGATPATQTCTTKTTSATGTFTCTFTVPSITPGPYTVVVSGSDVGTVPADTATATFTVIPSITLSPTQGPVGVTVTVTGANFAPSSTITIKFNGAVQTTIPATVTSSAAGAFTATFVVPASAAGAQAVTATDAHSNTGSATFTVTTPAITLSPTSGAVGTIVTVTGTGYSVSTRIGSIAIAGGTISTQTCTSQTTSAAGAFTCTFTVPAETLGVHTVTVSGNDVSTVPADTATATFTVTTPTIVLSPIQGPVGVTVTVTGASFASSSTITIKFNGATVTTVPATVTSSALGAFTATFVVPSSTAGAKTVTATDAISNSASATFTVTTPNIALSPTQGPVGTIVTVTGTGYSVSKAIGSISIAGGTIATQTCTSQTTSATGTFTCTFTVPTDTAGAHTVTVSGSDVGTVPADTATATFIVTTPNIALSPTQGPIGTPVTVTGSGFSVSTTIGTITFNGATLGTQTCTSQTTSAAGAFTCTFTVPSIASGPYAIVISGSDVGTVPADSASATFTVTIPMVTLSPTQGLTGTSVTVTGSGFSVSTAIGTMKFNGATPSGQTCTSQTTSATGTFTCTFTVPSIASGPYAVVVSGNNVGTVPADTATATFTVTTSTINLSPIQGPVGTTVTVTGTSFAPSSTITIKFNGATVTTVPATVSTSAAGTFSATFVVPSSTAGAQTVTATDASSNTASATFTITTPTIVLSTTQGPVGTSVTVTGSGFSVLTTIGTMTFNGVTPSGQTCTSQTTSATGTFTCTFTVPSVAVGTYMVYVSGSDVGTVPADSASATFAVTTPAITLSPTQSPVGTSVAVTGSGFSVLTTIGTMTFNGVTPSGQTCTSQTTSATGTFTCTFTVPADAVGTYAVVLSGSDVGTVPADTASTTFAVTSAVITLTPNQGPEGASVAVTGSGFSVLTTIGTMTFNGVTPSGQTCTSQTTSATGTFTCTFTVPSIAAGTYTVVISGSDIGSVPADTGSATFKITTPTITLSVTQAPLGTSVTVAGSGFSVSTAIGTITLDGNTPPTQTCTAQTTSATGAFTCTFIVPSLASGAYTVIISGSDVWTVMGDTASTTFTITTPMITLFPTQGPVGVTVTVTGSGFSVLTTIGTMTFNGVTPSGQTCTSQTTSATGTFTCTFTVPAIVFGPYAVVLSGSDVGTVPADTASATFTVTTPTITLSPVKGPQSTTVTVTGSGFSVLTTIGTMTFNGVTPSGQTCTSQTTSATGTFTCTFTVPADAVGTYAVVLSGSDVGTLPADSATANFKITTSGS